MNLTHLTNALLFGVPVVVSADIYGGFDSLLARRNQPLESAPDPAAKRRRRLSADAGAGLRFAIANSPEQLDAAYNLVRDRYAWRGYELHAGDVAAQPWQRRSLQEITFLAASGKAAVGTVTLGLDGPAGLLAEAGYGEVIGEFRAAGHRVCELTRLALAESIDSKAVLAALFSLTHAVGRTLDDVTHVLIEVNPRHVRFYSRVLGFVVAAGEKFCERVRARSVLLELEIEALEQRLMAFDVAIAMEPLIAKAA